MECCVCDAIIIGCTHFTAFPKKDVTKYEQAAIICGKCGTRLSLIMEFGYPPIRLDGVKGL